MSLGEALGLEVAIYQYCHNNLCWEIHKSVAKEGLCYLCNGQGGLGPS